MTPLDRLRRVASWEQPWRKQAGNAIARGFRDAVCGLPFDPPYKSPGLNEEYRAGFDLGVEWIADGVGSGARPEPEPAPPVFFPFRGSAQ